MLILSEIKSIEDNTKQLMLEEPRTRCNDKWLIFRYLQKYCNAVYIEDILDEDVPAFESITRARRKIQARGECLPHAIILFNRNVTMQNTYINYARSVV